MNRLELELAKATAVSLSAENWSKQYAKSPEQHAELIKQTSIWLVSLAKFFRDMAKNAGDFINVEHYNYQLAQAKSNLDKETLAYNVSVVVNGNNIMQHGGNFIKLSIKPVTKITQAGVASGPVLYGRQLSLPLTDASIQRKAMTQVAALIGKRVAADGSLVDNPNAEYHILDTVRNDIAQSVTNSLNAGLTSDEATQDVADIIGKDGYRAQLIANTESIRAFNNGVFEYGDQSGATGKYWDGGTIDDICETNVGDGVIGMGDEFSSGDDAPPAHPNCMCALVLDYGNNGADAGGISQDEIDANQIGGPGSADE